MKRILLSLSFIIFHLSFSPCGAQTPWTLEKCIDYAVEHNIAVRQIENQIEQRQLQLQTSKAQRLPDLNASAGQNFSFGRGLTAENTYTNTNTSSTSFSIGTSVPLFTGFQIPNQVKLSQLNLEAATKDLEKARNDIRTQVAQAFVQTLYDMEISNVARRQIAIDSAQVARLKVLLEVGRASHAELSQQQATLAQSQLTATQAQNNVQLALLNLSQLLELDTPEGFAIAVPDSSLHSSLLTPHSSLLTPHSSLLTPESIFAEAVGIRPEIQSEQLRLKATEHSIKIAQAGLYPSLSFSAGLGTNYYTTNRLQTRSSIRSARVDRLNQQLQLDNVRKQLYKEIQQAYYNTVAARQKLASSQQARQASQDAFALVQAKYEQGKATITEFNEARNNMLKAESDLTQARYEYLYQTALIRFYQGKPMTF